ncbi:protein-L-isoaspartate O-methyltransferase family protein [Phreatobacter sp.]|uniref:protein-L-isoaspartate O-methyltransferase family protein n=1 Tax=Phreatobacter sp. TaxID=1966341 RepID=UPI003F71826F
MNEAPGPEHFRAAAEFVLMLRHSGLAGTRVLRAMEQVPRVPFLDPSLFALADEDIALPIGCGQTLLAPTLTAAMIGALDVEPGHRVLHVGTGTGYVAAILGRLAASVVTVERWRSLADAAHLRLRTLGYAMVEVVFGDGLEGFPPRAPYDRILLTCAIDELPSGLLAQLARDGVVVAAFGQGGGAKEIVRLARVPHGFDRQVITTGPVDPAASGTARRL